MKVTMLLADAAEAVNGKLYILGGGWSVAGPEAVQSAIALKIEVPWDQANRRHSIVLSLQNADGHPVVLPTPDGERPVEIRGDFEVGRPAGLTPGTPLDAAVAINLGRIPLPPGQRYVWRLTIDGQSFEDWHVAFSTRAGASGQGRLPSL
jgi:hypothetical protein